MRVLLASPFFSQHFDAGHFWLRALSRLGHSVLAWDYRLDPKPPAGAYDFSLVLKGDAITPHLLDGPKACYWPDEWGREPGAEAELKEYSHVYTMVRPTPPGVTWLPGAWEPVIHGSHQAPWAGKDTIDSIFIGTHTPYKEMMLKVISPQLLYGNGWEGVLYAKARIIYPEPAIYLQHFAKWLAQSKVAVNIHRVPTIGVTRRLFEFMACTFTITDRVPGVEEILGKKLADQVAFTTAEQGRVMLEHFLAHPQERAELWVAEKKAIQPYTYEALAQRIIEEAA